MSEKRMVNWVTDREWMGSWAGDIGLIIGSGKSATYEEAKQNKKLLESFPGKIIGCNEAFRFLDKIDLTIWIDNVVHVNQNWMERFIQNKAVLMHVDPYDWKGNFYGREVLGLRATPPPDRFSESFDTGFCPCNDTGYLCIQVGFILGLQEIYLWGFDAWVGSYNRKAGHFGVAAKWAKEHSRELYVSEETSFLCHEDHDHEKILDFKPLPIPCQDKGKDNTIEYMEV